LVAALLHMIRCVFHKIDYAILHTKSRWRGELVLGRRIGSAWRFVTSRDLVCWQLADSLTCEVYAFTADGPVSRDFRYRDQIRDSASGAPRALPKGSADSARVISRGSWSTRARR